VDEKRVECYGPNIELNYLPDGCINPNRFANATQGEEVVVIVVLIVVVVVVGRFCQGWRRG